MRRNMPYKSRKKKKETTNRYFFFPGLGVVRRETDQPIEDDLLL
jgi:hypothetical protein